jgi:hypothetical protein
VTPKSPTCPRSFAPQQYASREAVIAQVCLAPALIETNFTPGCTACGVSAQSYDDVVPPQLVSTCATPS